MSLFEILGRKLGFEARSAEYQCGQFGFTDAPMDELLDNIVGVVADIVSVTVSNDTTIVQHHNPVANLVGAFHVVRHNHACRLHLLFQFQH